MNDGMILTVTAFIAVSSLALLLSLLFRKSQDPVAARMDDLREGRGERPSQTRVGPRSRKESRSLLSLLIPTGESGRKLLGDRLVQAGLYRRNSVVFYIAVKVVLMGLPIVVAVMMASAGLLPMRHAVLFGIATSIAGTLLPSLWLDFQKRKRQTDLRRALPDAVDVIVICVEAGLSLPAALVRVSGELATAHPMLAAELMIVQREIQMGYTTGQALKRFADRFDIEELRSLASVVEQSEKYGASIVKALRVHAESLRIKRFQRAEEKARTAAVKLLFPTVLFIFPALFVVLIGPAVFDVFELIFDLQRKVQRVG
jgi:tight adherence protein C